MNLFKRKEFWVAVGLIIFTACSSDDSKIPSDRSSVGVDTGAENALSGLPVVFVDQVKHYILDGDILLTESEARRVVEDGFDQEPVESEDRSIVALTNEGVPNIWTADFTNLSYWIDPKNFSPEQYLFVATAMKQASSDWNEACANCRFEFNAVDAPEEAEFLVEYFQSPYFYAVAFLPDQPKNERKILISDSFFEQERYNKTGIVRHELGHVLGFRHEQIRRKELLGCTFEDTQWKAVNDYDSQSVMHYLCGVEGVRKWELSASDIDAVNRLYGKQTQSSNQQIAAMTDSNSQPAPLDAVLAIPDGKCHGRTFEEVASRVVNGDDAHKKHWPGFASLVFVSPNENGNILFECGAVALDSRHALTAAHCFDFAKPSEISGVVGTRSRSDNLSNKDFRLGIISNHDTVQAADEQTISWVESYEIFEDGATTYNSEGQRHNDLAIVTVNEDTPLLEPFSTISGSIEYNPRFEGHPLWIGGFGRTESGTYFDIPIGDRNAVAGAENLQEAVLELGLPATCSAIYKYQISDELQICSGWSHVNRDSCQGDSGGPIVAIDNNSCPVVLGLTSYGKTECGSDESWAIYTRLASYRNWIQQRVPETQFSSDPIPVIGSKATSKLMDSLIESYAAKSQNGNIRITNEDGVPYMIEDGAFIVPKGGRMVYELSTDHDASGKVLLVNRTKGGDYDLIYPRPDTPVSLREKIYAGQEAIIIGVERPGVSGIPTWVAGKTGSDDEHNELIALLLPVDVSVSRLILMQMEVTSRGPERIVKEPALAYSEAAYVASLIGSNSQKRDEHSSVKASKIDYVIR